MKTCRSNWFKLKCQLWGADSGLFGGDDHHYTFDKVYFFPDGTPTASENRVFDVILGEGVLNEDIGTDEVYAKLLLYNLVSGTPVVVKKSNQVSHSF